MFAKVASTTLPRVRDSLSFEYSLAMYWASLVAVLRDVYSSSCSKKVVNSSHIVWVSKWILGYAKRT